MSNDVSDYTILIEKGCRSWRKGDDYEGILSLQQACLLWLDKLEQEDREDAGPSHPEYDQITQTICKLLNDLEQSDIALAMDVMEYELLPRLNQENPVFEGSPSDVKHDS